MKKRIENIESIGFAEVTEYSPTLDEEKKILEVESQTEKEIADLKKHLISPLK